MAKGFLSFAIAAGASRQSLLARSGIDPAELDPQEGRLPLSQYRALMDAARELCEEPALALHFGEQTDLSEMSITALVSQASATAKEGLEQLNRYWRLLVDDGGRGPTNRIQLRQGRRGAWIELIRNPYLDFPGLIECSLARCAGGFARSSGGKKLAKEVHVTHDDPGYQADYDRIFRAPTIFGSDRNALLIDQGILSYRLPRSNRYAFHLLRQQAQKRLTRLEGTRTVRSRVEHVLFSKLRSGALGMDEIAADLGMSRQTLYRRLRDEGVVYQDLLDELRQELALTFLRWPGSSVKQVAFSLGYSEPSAFSRAFQRWTGERPSRFVSNTPNRT